MKKLLLIVAVLMGLALVTSVYAQKWDTALTAEAMAKGKPFTFTGEIKSIDKDAGTAMVKVGNKTYLGRFGYAKFEGGYSGVSDLKVGDKVKGKGQVVNGENWVTNISLAGGAPAPGGGMAPSK
jgi:hypothetical protein